MKRGRKPFPGRRLTGEEGVYVRHLLESAGVTTRRFTEMTGCPGSSLSTVLCGLARLSRTEAGIARIPGKNSWDSVVAEAGRETAKGFRPPAKEETVTVTEMERKHIRARLKEAGENYSTIARRAGVSREAVRCAIKGRIKSERILKDAARILGKASWREAVLEAREAAAVEGGSAAQTVKL